MARPSFTLGIEEEFQVIDPTTYELKSHIQEMFAEGTALLKEEMKRELHDPVIEVGTPICRDVTEARREITRLRSEIVLLARRAGLRVASMGTHPFTDWKTVPITPGAHYDSLVEDLQMIARANLIFGLHVHVGVEDDDARIAIMNGVRYFLPHIFALSTNSPFWMGQNTGWKSFRAKIFERFPRTGIPDSFASWGEYQDFLNTLIATGCIADGKKIWWDVRIHPYFPTLEYRICDAQMRIDETICMAAFFQAVTYRLWKLYDKNQGWRMYRRTLIDENKWRAARFGLDGKLIDLGKKTEVPTESLLLELLEFVDGVVSELESTQEIAYVHEIMRRRTGADRQLAVYKETGDLKAVVQYAIGETEVGTRIA
ncbi:MAG: carboxylate-amine ligase [Candidatus Eremiobacteraeota bacterium]|nr:carboxylate-amine ligase [Candidatus Eremiobacteraeota bacterium]